MLVDVLTGAWSGAFGYSSHEHGDELADSSSLEKVEAGQVGDFDEFMGGVGIVTEDLSRDVRTPCC